MESKLKRTATDMALEISCQEVVLERHRNRRNTLPEDNVVGRKKRGQKVDLWGHRLEKEERDQEERDGTSQSHKILMITGGPIS
mgnify:CR=1 FL=1